MKMNITIEPMGRGHVLTIEASIGLKPGWQEHLKDRIDDITANVANDLQSTVNKQLPSKLTRYSK